MKRKQAYIALIFGFAVSLAPVGAAEGKSKSNTQEQKTPSKEQNVATSSETAVQNNSSVDQSTAQADNKNAQLENLESAQGDQNLASAKEFIIAVDTEKGAVIEEIISTMGKSSVVALGFKKGHLKALGKKINGIGPLHFLGYIFSKQELKLHMKNIRKSSLKWNGFMDGLKPSLDREASSEDLHEKLPGFAQALKVNVEPLKARADNRDWNGFVGYLIEN